jgi:glycosyltransferase involved in cell wall biosynthesis
MSRTYEKSKSYQGNRTCICSAGSGECSFGLADKVMINDKFSVSVIIPVYNGARFLSEAIASIRWQNYEPLEIIIVDDGSTDDTAKVALSQGRDIRYIYQHNAGPASARNSGIKAAQGTIIRFLDADDLWPENTVRILVHNLMSEPDVEVINGCAQLLEYNTAVGRYASIGNPKDSFPFYIGSAIYRRAAFTRVGLFDATLQFGEDWDWFMRAAESAVKIKRIEDVTLFVRRHDQNMTLRKPFRYGMLHAVRRSIERRATSDDRQKDATSDSEQSGAQ